MEKNRIYLGDCLELMKDVPGKSINMILCDLPYGTTQNKWDSCIDLNLLWAQYNRIIKDNGAIVLTAQTPFDKVLGCSNLKMLKYEWIWQKNVSTGHLNANKAPMKIHENVLVFSNGQTVYNPQKQNGKPYRATRKAINDNGSNYGDIKKRTDTINEGDRFPNSILQFPREIGLHPTQKPVALFEYLIRTYTREDNVVLDNCAGSGTTGIACINTDRNFILMEKDEKYFQIAQERILKQQLGDLY